MPLIPKFSISQDDEFVLVKITLPYIRISSAEVIADGYDFSFFCQPYLLKLTFPCELHDDDERCKSVYDPSVNNGTLTAFLPKKNHGEFFPGLDLTTNLLQIRKEKEIDSTCADGIEILNSLDYENDSSLVEDDELTTLQSSMLRIGRTISYGFNLKYSKVLLNLRDELVDMLEIRDPENVPVVQRRILRIQSENRRFNIERYLGDLFDCESDPLYIEAMSFKPFWVRQWDLYKSEDKDQQTVSKPTAAAEAHLNRKDQAFETLGGFTSEENETLRNGLKHREYLISSGSLEEKTLLLTLADILYAYCYDVRTTAGEERNVESASNIARMTCALSWLDPFNSPQDNISSVIKYSMRRSIILPYLRVWKLSRKVLTDVVKILFLGRRSILKCLLQIRNTFEHTDTHYLLNKIFIDDYCVWIQNTTAVSDDTLQSFAKEYNSAKTAIESLPCQGKETAGLHLVELELWAIRSQQEERDSESEGEDEEDSASDSSDGEEDDSSSSSSSASSDEDEDEDEKEQGGVVEENIEDSFLQSIPKDLRCYDDLHLTSEHLEYLDVAAVPNVLLPLEEDQTDSATIEMVSSMLRSDNESSHDLITNDFTKPGTVLSHEEESASTRDVDPAAAAAAAFTTPSAAVSGVNNNKESGSSQKRVLIEVLSEQENDDSVVADTSKKSSSLFLREVSTTKKVKSDDLAVPLEPLMQSVEEGISLISIMDSK